MATTHLTAIQEVIEDLDYRTIYSPPEESAPFERLSVLIGNDAQQRPLTLQLYFINDIAFAVGGGEDEEDTHDAIFLQFMLLLPTPVQADRFGEVAEYVLLINRILPVGAFGISRPDGTVYFQYSLGLAEREVDENVLDEVVQMIEVFVNKFEGNIAEISSGKMRAAAAIQALTEEGVVPPPLGPTATT